MRRLFCLTLSFALAMCGCKHPVENIHLDPHQPENYQVKIKIPDEWIEKIRRFDYSRKTQPSLIKEFADIIKPDTLHDPHAEHAKEGYGRVFDPIFSDIDGEAGDELICLLGWDIGCPYLCVFKQQQNGWYLIYFENIHTYYSAPTLSIANNFSKNKVFYYRQVDGHGSDVYFDSYHFYKLIDGKVYKCLNLSNEQRDYGSKLWMSKEIEMNFEFGGDESDGVGVNYTYNFFSGGVEPLIKDEINVSYKWSNRNKKYQIDIYPFQNEEDNLIDKKIDFFNSSGEDSLFVTAFKDKIDKLLKEGSPRQKQALNNYLIEQKKEQKQLHQTNH